MSRVRSNYFTSTYILSSSGPLWTTSSIIVRVGFTPLNVRYFLIRHDPFIFTLCVFLLSSDHAVPAFFVCISWFTTYLLSKCVSVAFAFFRSCLTSVTQLAFFIRSVYLENPLCQPTIIHSFDVLIELSLLFSCHTIGMSHCLSIIISKLY